MRERHAQGDSVDAPVELSETVIGPTVREYLLSDELESVAILGVQPKTKAPLPRRDARAADPVKREGKRLASETAKGFLSGGTKFAGGDTFGFPNL